MYNAQKSLFETDQVGSMGFMPVWADLSKINPPPYASSQWKPTRVAIILLDEDDE